MEFIKFATLHKEIMGAITFLRTCNSPIISAETIDFMKKVSLDKLKHMESVNKIKAKTKGRQK